jgi:serine/threonine protein kinase
MTRTVRYHVVNKIAHGGMAEIFLALQMGAEGFEKQVVLKRILPALAVDPAFVRMLVDEAHIASTLNHSNLVQVLDLGKSGDEFFLVLEFVDGWSLEQVRRRAQKARVKLPLPQALHIVGSLCRALAYVHTRRRNGRPLGIVHRDVTPQNVLLSREGEVKLADFGIAKAIGRREKSATGVIKGKFAYMSPEQSLGEDLDARSDLFSVGTLLYILTTGRKPFEGPTDLDVLMQVRKARYEKPSVLVKDFNPEVERFIARALRSERSRRWQTAAQMADRLDAILVKLGQPSGPAALKRWLDNLSAKDGVQPPAELATIAGSDTIEIVSRDLELQEVPSPPDGADDGRSPPAAHPHVPTPAGLPVVSAPPVLTTTGAIEDEATRGMASEITNVPGSATVRMPADNVPVDVVEEPFRKGTSPSWSGSTPAPLATMPASIRSVNEVTTRTAPPTSAVLDAEVAFAASTRTAARGRSPWLKVMGAVVVLTLAGVSAYWARASLPSWLIVPLRTLLQRLPASPDAGDWTGDPRVSEPPTPLAPPAR